MLVCLFLFRSFAAHAEMLFPPDGHLADESPVSVMVFVEEGDPTTVSFTNESGAVGKIELSAGFNIEEIEMSPGKNIIKYGEDSREIFCASGDNVPPEGFTSHLLHEAMDSCDNCHAGDEGLDLNSESPDLCYDCHDNQVEGEAGPRASVHEPVVDGDCLTCHDPHFSGETGLLLSAVPVLCYDCHDEVTADENQEPLLNQHDPVESGDCLDCHLVHSSDEGPLLAAPGGELCADCHDDPTANNEGGEKSNIHEPLASGECTSCHLIHGSEVTSLLSSPLETLCEECHDYPLFDDEGERRAFLHEPAETLDCLSCHDPHASDYTGMTLMEEKDLCLECHDDPALDPDGEPYPLIHEVIEDGCLGCHGPHGSDYRYFLSVEGPALCYECHDDVTLNENDSPFEVPHLPAQEGQCSACHRPHASKADGLLQGVGNGYCVACHDEFHEEHRDSYSESAMVSIPADFPVAGGALVCVGCHAPHGSDNEYLFIKQKMFLCGRCHNI